MTSTLRTLSAAAAAALLFSLAACSSGPATTATPTPTEDAATSVILDGACDADEGVTVAVDGSALEGGSLDEWCVITDETIVAADAFAIAAVQTEGTEEYGDQVVCRVNGLPAEDQALTSADGTEYFETCETMAPAWAYWALWVKPADGEWDYAQEGAATQQLEPGESVALLFTLNDEPAEPTT